MPEPIFQHKNLKMYSEQHCDLEGKLLALTDFFLQIKYLKVTENYLERLH